jgi:hypothetical protein
LALYNHNSMRWKYWEEENPLRDEDRKFNKNADGLEFCWNGGHLAMADIPLQHPIYTSPGAGKLAIGGTPSALKYGTAT